MAFLVFVSGSAATGHAAQPITDEDVDIAVHQAVDFLWSKQRYDGTWGGHDLDKVTPTGLTALAAYTLRLAGAPLTDYRLQRAAVALLDRSEVKTVFARAFTLLFWCVTVPERFEQQIAEDVRFLKLQQGEDGGWGYGSLSETGLDRPWSDNSHSQLALMALWEAASVGVDVPDLIWRRSEQCWLATQNADGGWGYPLAGAAESPAVPRDSYGTMTAAGSASLHLIYDRLYRDEAAPFNGRFKARCGEDIEDTRPIREALDRARAWRDANFRADTVPGLDIPSPDDYRDPYLSYYLYAAGRGGVLSGLKRFGTREWPREIAEGLVRTQQPDGSWGDVHQTCFGVLTLLTVRAPVLINKLKYGDAKEWNNDPRDAANLTRWFSRQAGVPRTWQVVDLAADGDDLYDAPVLLITGHEAPKLDETQQSMLRDFINAGGTVLAVACCSRESFVEECRDLFRNMFPRLRCAPLPEDHPVRTLHDTVKPGDDCLGVSDACRTSIFILTNGACCAWQQNLIHSEARHFALGGNILRYATFGQSLRGRLAEDRNRFVARPLQMVTAARLRHGGDWWVDPDSLKHVSTVLSTRIGLGVEEKPYVPASRLRRSGARAIWVTGRTFEPLTAHERAGLKSYLLSGGTLIASACCGHKTFDEPFRAFVADLFGPFAWEAIGANDPMITGAVAPGLASSLGNVSYRPRFQGPLPARVDRPLLYGVRHNGRWMVIYSPVDINGGICRHPCLDCVGYVTRDAQAIVANIFLYIARQEAVAESR